MNDNDWFFDGFGVSEKTAKRGTIALIALWLLGVLLSLAISIGTIVLIVVLIMHFA